MYFFKDKFKNTQLTNDTIGLDIGSSMLKWVVFGPKNDSYVLKDYAVEAISTNIVYQQIKAVSQIATSLKRALDKKVFVKNCVLNIPDNLVSSKWVQIDNAAYKNLEDTIRLVAEQSIPYPINSLYFDYQIVDPPLQQQKNFKVLLVACRKEHLDQRLDIISQANLIPIAVELSSHAIERAYNYFYPDSIHNDHLLLDLGASQLTLLFLGALKNTLSFSESLLNPTDKQSILLQIKRCIKRFYLAYPYYALSQLFFIESKHSVLQFLLKKLDGFLGLKTSILNYRQQIPAYYKLTSNTVANLLPNLILSYGLALRPYQHVTFDKI